MDGWVGGWMGGWMDGWRKEGMEVVRKDCSSHLYLFPLFPAYPLPHHTLTPSPRSLQRHSRYVTFVAVRGWNNPPKAVDVLKREPAVPSKFTTSGE